MEVEERLLLEVAGLLENNKKYKQLRGLERKSFLLILFIYLVFIINLIHFLTDLTYLPVLKSSLCNFFGLLACC